LAASALLHVLVYGALSVAPAWTPPPRAGLVVTEVIVTEPPPPVIRTPRPVTPPRPPAKPQPRKSREQVARPEIAPKVEPPVEHDVAAEPPPTTTVAETARQVSDTPSAPTPPAQDGALRAGNSSLTTFSPQDSGPAVAALPPAPSAAVAGAPTRSAIPRGGYQITPSYPAAARRAGIEGTTVLGVFVETDGRVAEVVVKQSAGHPDLDRAAADAVRRWRFEPARRGSEAVAMWVELPVQFQLR